MSTETETEGRALMAFLAGLSGALGALADHPRSSAAPPEIADALGDAVRGFRHGEHNVHQALNAKAEASDPWARGLPKILAEITASHQAFVAVLATWELSWWTRRLEELKPSDQAEPALVVDREVGHGIG